MGLADAYMVFVFLPIGLAFSVYALHKMTSDTTERLTAGEWWAIAGFVVMMVVGYVLMDRDPGMRRNMQAARLRAARRAARRPTMTIEITVH